MFARLFDDDRYIPSITGGAGRTDCHQARTISACRTHRYKGHLWADISAMTIFRRAIQPSLLATINRREWHAVRQRLDSVYDGLRHLFLCSCRGSSTARTMSSPPYTHWSRHRCSGCEACSIGERSVRSTRSFGKCSLCWEFAAGCACCRCACCKRFYLLQHAALCCNSSTRITRSSSILL
jgi:hypothetical protein